MSVATPQSSGHLQNMLQASVQSIQWTYSLFWQLCPQQGILIWGDGYYNGAIKTRKTVQPMEVSSEEASLQRSQQLRELYDSLSAGDAGQPAKRPCASLSPEDLTESEWFYLMCVSFSFSPGSGLPGRAFARRQHVWLTGANEVDSKTFSRAILAKSAMVQTVFCIPLHDGVVEFGTTEKVHEDLELVKHVKTFFTGHHHKNPQPPPKPALSEHSTSNPVTSTEQQLSHYSSPVTAIHSALHPPITPNVPENDNDIDAEDDGDDDDDDDDEEDEEEEEPESESVETIRRRRNRIAVTQDLEMDFVGATEAEAEAEASELMQMDMSEDIRLGSPEDLSNNLDSDFNLLPLTDSGNPVEQQCRVDSFNAESTRRWSMLQDPLNDGCSLQPTMPLLTDPPQLEEWEMTQEEDTHYSQTVSTILQTHSTRGWVESSATTGYVSYSSNQSAFANWITNESDQQHHHHSPPDRVEGTSQLLLKYILFTVPFLHSKYHDENSPRASRDASASVSVSVEASAAAGRLRKGSSQEELSLSANHVLAERRRREKLNERFVILRSLVPFVTKMDKASILGDTIEYVKQLRKKIQDLEIHNRQMELDNSQRRPTNTIATALKDQLRSSTARVCGQDKRKMRIVEANNGAAKPNTVVDSTEMTTVTSVEVSIIETDALLELQCVYREGLLLDIMQLLREIRIETTAVQSSCNNGVFVAEIRAKVKESINGKKTSIVEVKRGINQIIPQN